MPIEMPGHGLEAESGNTIGRGAEAATSNEEPTPAADSQIVARASGSGTDGDSVDETTLYTVPSGGAGFYRATQWVYPTTPSGSGDVTHNLHWPQIPPGSGNLDPSFTGGDIQTRMNYGESSTGPGFQQTGYYIEDGGVVSFDVTSSFDGGSWVWAVVLEKLSPLSA